MTEPGGPAWRQSTFFPFAETAKHARNARVLAVNVEAPTHHSTQHGEVPLLHASAVIGGDTDCAEENHGPVTVFAVNRSQEQSLPLHVDLRGLPRLTRVVEHRAIHDEDPDAANTLRDSERVGLKPIDGTVLTEPATVHAALIAVLPPMSWNLIRLA
jgi:alpha-N-arabinofuranosidase